MTCHSDNASQWPMKNLTQVDNPLFKMLRQASSLLDSELSQISSLLTIRNLKECESRYTKVHY